MYDVPFCTRAPHPNAGVFRPGHFGPEDGPSASTSPSLHGPKATRPSSAVVFFPTRVLGHPLEQGPPKRQPEHGIVPGLGDHGLDRLPEPREPKGAAAGGRENDWTRHPGPGGSRNGWLVAHAEDDRSWAVSVLLLLLERFTGRRHPATRRGPSTGSRTVKVLPFPISEETSISPPWAFTIL